MGWRLVPTEYALFGFESKEKFDTHDDDREGTRGHVVCRQSM